MNISSFFVNYFRNYMSVCLYWIALAPFLSPIARFMGPTWGPSGVDRTQVGPMLALWILLSGVQCCRCVFICCGCMIGSCWFTSLIYRHDCYTDTRSLREVNSEEYGKMGKYHITTKCTKVLIMRIFPGWNLCDIIELTSYKNRFWNWMLMIIFSVLARFVFHSSWIII